MKMKTKKNYHFALFSKSPNEEPRLVKKYSLLDKARQEGLQLIRDEIEMARATSECYIFAVGIDSNKKSLLLTLSESLKKITETFNF